MPRNLLNIGGRKGGGTTGDLTLKLSGTDGNGRGCSVCGVIRNPKDIGWKKGGGTTGDLALEPSGISERRGINLSCQKNPNEYRWEEWGEPLGTWRLSCRVYSGKGRSICRVIRSLPKISKRRIANN